MNDYISREEAIETIQYRVCQGHGNKELICKRGSCAYCGIMEVMSDISRIEATDVQPVKHGRWIEASPKHSRCSVCDTTCLIAVYPISKGANFCPNCGARMDGEVE